MADSSNKQLPTIVNPMDEVEYISSHLPCNGLKPNPKDCIPVSVQERMSQSNPINRTWLEARERDMKRDS
jgi:hypothetical protein